MSLRTYFQESSSDPQEEPRKQKFETTVVNIRKHDYDVLIDRRTKFGNPFTVKKHGRSGCLAKYSRYFRNKYQNEPEFRKKVLNLKGKKLGCWCVHEPISHIRNINNIRCHGEIILSYLEGWDSYYNVEFRIYEKTAQARCQSCGKIIDEVYVNQFADIEKVTELTKIDKQDWYRIIKEIRWDDRERGDRSRYLCSCPWPRSNPYR
jgi:hypothetical protein